MRCFIEIIPGTTKNSANWNTAFQGGKNVTTSWIVLISDDGAVSEAFGKTLSAGGVERTGGIKQVKRMRRALVECCSELLRWKSGCRLSRKSLICRIRSGRLLFSRMDILRKRGSSRTGSMRAGFIMRSNRLEYLF